jgi:acetyl esterase/lipase
MHQARDRVRILTPRFLPTSLLALSTAIAAGCAVDDPDDLDGLDETEASAALGPITGLSAEYFRSNAPDPRQRMLARVDPNLDFVWGFGSPDPLVPADYFSARGSGTIQPRYSEVYTLTAKADDTAKVWIDGALVIDYRNLFTPASGQVALTAGRKHQIVVEYAEAGWWSSLRLEWQSASQPAEAVPESRLAPAPRPPAQPSAGPGGAAYPHGGCTMTHRPVWWNDDLSYWVFEPAAPVPASGDLVVFNHGWMGNAPSHYAHWLDHLCRKGNVVIFPRYQSLLTLPGFFTGNAVWSVKDALAWLAMPGRVRPRTEQGMVVMGHSAGGTVSANMVDAYAANGLPLPRALFAVQPAADNIVPYGPMTSIPATAKLACWAGEDDDVVGRLGCDTIISRATQVPGKRYIWQLSDDHGAPALAADHFQPSELTGYTDSLDYYGTWRIGDAMIDCAFRGTSCSIGAGPTLDMGAWSDGVAVTPARAAIDSLPACPAGATAVGC